MGTRTLAAIFALSMCVATTVACGAAPEDGTASVQRTLTSDHGDYTVVSDYLVGGGHDSHVFRKSDAREVARVIQAPGVETTVDPSAGGRSLPAVELVIGNAPPVLVPMIISQSELSAEALPTWNIVVAYMVSTRLK